MPNNVDMPLKTLSVVQYRERSAKQWKYIWEHAINANPALKDAFMIAERKTEAILNILGEGAGPEGRDTVSGEIQFTQECIGVGSFIDGHAQGYVEACDDLDSFLNQTAETMGLKYVAMKCTLYIALFFAFGTWYLNL